MPFAVDVNSRAYAIGFFLGKLTIGVVCGLWPLIAGCRKGRPLAGVAGFVACMWSGFAFGYILAVPVAIVFTTLIGAASRPKPPCDDDVPEAPFNPYAGGKASAFPIKS